MDDLQLTAEQAANALSLGRSLATRAALLDDLRSAVDEARGFAAGRIGMSQKHWMYYPLLLGRKAANAKVYRLFERRLVFHGLNQEGVFPPDPRFYLRYNEFYVPHVRNLDYLGVYLNAWDIVLERPIIQAYGLENRLVHYVELHPDRNAPNRPENCYLPFLRGKRVLIVCPFASVLCQRATESVFEAVWRKIGKKWFFPASVEGLDVPYGFARTTRTAYATAFELYEAIVAEIRRRDFDVALIGAGGLAIPIASFVKSVGKIGLDLGGHLQIVFGVIGKKWRRLDRWEKAYFNEAWIDMPTEYRPDEEDVCVEDGEAGAYW